MLEISISVCRTHPVSHIGDLPVISRSNDLAFSLEEENPMIQWLAVHDEPLIYREFRYTVEFKSMWESEKHQWIKAYPLLCRTEGRGLSGRCDPDHSKPSSKKGLVYDEVQLISSVTSVASIAIKNARLYEKAALRRGQMR